MEEDFMSNGKWQHAGVLVENDRIKNWENAEVFGITAMVRPGAPWPEVLKMIGAQRWEMCAAESDGKGTRFCFTSGPIKNVDRRLLEGGEVT
jgi:hypothetical protein